MVSEVEWAKESKGLIVKKSVKLGILVSRNWHPWRWKLSSILSQGTTQWHTWIVTNFTVRFVFYSTGDNNITSGQQEVPISNSNQTEFVSSSSLTADQSDDKPVSETVTCIKITINRIKRGKVNTNTNNFELSYAVNGLFVLNSSSWFAWWLCQDMSHWNLRSIHSERLSYRFTLH